MSDDDYNAVTEWRRAVPDLTEAEAAALAEIDPSPWTDFSTREVVVAYRKGCLSTGRPLMSGESWLMKAAKAEINRKSGAATNPITMNEAFHAIRQHASAHTSPAVSAILNRLVHLGIAGQLPASLVLHLRDVGRELRDERGDHE